jgi:MFS family permease
MSEAAWSRVQAREGDRAAATRRNLLLLAAGMAALYGMVELVFGVASVTFEESGGSESLAGFAPALFLASAGLAALPAGRTMDRAGPRRVLAAGFAAGLAGCLLAGLGAEVGSVVPALAGFVLTGVATGTVLLSRAAAAAMFPPQKRPRAIAQVLFGAVFGALLGPLVFGPLLGDGASALDAVWLGGAGFMAVGLIGVSRLDPRPFEPGGEAEANDPSPDRQPDDELEPSRALGLIVATPGILPALLAVLASWAGMVTAMSLIGPALIDHGHEHGAVFPVLAAHFVGMFAFFAVVGPVIERIGRTRAIAAGLVVMAAASGALAGAVEAIHLAALALFGVGLGWSLSFVAATAELAERARSGERATLIGFADLLGQLSGAGLVVAGGLALDAAGVVAVGIGAAALPLVASVWILLTARVRSPSEATSA